LDIAAAAGGVSPLFGWGGEADNQKR